MAPAPGSRVNGRRASRRDDVRQVLTETMQRLLDEGEHYGQLSIERLAAEAGMSRTRFYMYFEDKADLLQSAYAKVLAESTDSVEEWWGAAEAPDHAALRRIVGRLVRIRAEHVGVATAVHEAATSDPIAREALDAIKADIVVRFTAVIAAGQQRGDTDPSLDAAATAGWLGWMIERGIDQLVADDRPVHLRRVAETVTTIVWRTLYEPAPTRRA